MIKNKRIYIQGFTGTGKTYFYLPEVIKLINNPSGKVYNVKTTGEEFRGKFWTGINVLDYSSELVTKNDLILCDGLEFIKNPEIHSMLANHPFVVLISQEPITRFDYLDSHKFQIIKSEYIKYKKFPASLFDNRVAKKLEELKSKV